MNIASICLFFASLSNERSCFAFAGRTTRRKQVEGSVQAVCREDVDTLILPIFPLRKKVQIPTESLTLNLYEERYLQMAEFILKSDHRLFGALSASNKPQVVARGTGPIVPMVEVGDIGVICCVDSNEEALIPTVGGTPRRRIRLEATAIGRFRIKTILHPGYDSSSKADSFPFILVEGKVVVDNSSDSSLDEEISILARSGKRFGELSQDKLYSLLSTIERVLPSMSEQELKSFALTAAKLPEGASQERLDVLCGQDRRERLRLGRR